MADKRYLVFAMDTYYPSGGMGDMIGSTDTLEEALEVVRGNGRDWHEIYDRVEGESIDLEPHGLE